MKKTLASCILLTVCFTGYAQAGTIRASSQHSTFPATLACGVVSNVQGEAMVFAMTGPGWRPARKGMSLESGDNVKAAKGSSVSVQFDSGAVATLKNEGQVAVKSNSKLTLFNGTLTVQKGTVTVHDAQSGDTTKLSAGQSIGKPMVGWRSVMHGKDNAGDVTMKDGKPFFLNLWYFLVHTPIEGRADLIARYEKKTAPRGQQKSPVMGAMVASLDENIGRLLPI